MWMGEHCDFCCEKWAILGSYVRVVEVFQKISLDLQERLVQQPGFTSVLLSFRKTNYCRRVVARLGPKKKN